MKPGIDITRTFPAATQALFDGAVVPGAELVDQFGVQRVALDHLADAGLL